jgi:uncharacterized alpha-E superfamily protein
VLQTDLVLKLLIADESNPRSLGFQLAGLMHQIQRLQEQEEGSHDTPEYNLALSAVSLVRSSQMADLSRRDPDGHFPALVDLSEELKSKLWDLSEALTSRYFSNLTACRLTASS